MEVADLKAKVAEAEAQKGKEAKELASKLAADLEEVEKNAAEKAREAEIAEAAAVTAADPMRAAELLAADPILQEAASKARRTWTDTLREAGRTHQLGFQVRATGWENVDAPQDWEPPPSPAERCLPTDDCVPNEFFPEEPPIVCPGQVSTLVLGAFDEGVDASRATTCGVRYRGVDYTEQVQPDGTFSLIALGGLQFELKTQKVDGTSGFTFGPFFAERAGRTSFLGLLEPPRDGSLKWDDIISKVELVLPALDYPQQPTAEAHRERRADSYEEGDTDGPHQRGRRERCTCFGAEGEISDYDEY
eukprot:TRINITY_DN19482_c0_g1_i1.p1 TRINITY_DN19482_c0_g1~~TRINITY_DN19482_c0_g1_i1.p1  ORF type:complete len:305 (-),score=66.55 TRINITY_DN19482_c0_g1_i1:296-1210(-)